ncbi:hypothetical protein SAMN02746009_02474 [Hymenobacter psychrotolerans DSM 18569]|uniref:Uncharacterized protein n=1 Tax=Hymenobacter psychrotolerans DSM 18569 TaxID=1121959 RepID=A0A1M6ZAL4_9BACT|nr:hypothetical protein SAMN02746009_02474 [Hymenobacter psychrotolerans DSM 18569]
MMTTTPPETPARQSSEATPTEPKDWGWVVYTVLFVLLIIGRLAVQSSAGPTTTRQGVPIVPVQSVQNSVWPYHTAQHSGSGGLLPIQ